MTGAAAEATPRVRPLDGFSVTGFGHEGVTRAVYRAGSGPGVLLMHEIPGITPPVIRLARALCDAGFTVAMPHLFGTPGKPWSLPYTWASLAKVCVRREFRVLASERSSPITRWLRALAGALDRELGGGGIGALGLCLTGNFALALMLDDAVVAPVLAQPSLPLFTGASAARRLAPGARRGALRPRSLGGAPRQGARPALHRRSALSARALRPLPSGAGRVL